jgi:hypothetical protein
MFLKRPERRKNGKRHTYRALVESVRTAGGSRHRVVAYLGELTARESSGWATLGRRLDRKDRPLPTLFDLPRHDEMADDEPVLVNLKGVWLQRLRDFGDVWLALGLWRLLGLDDLLSRVMPPGREDVPWPVVAAILAIAPLAQPQGKAHLSVTWKRNGRWGEWAAVSEGCYLLRTNLTETDPAVLWKRYIQLTEAEWAFRITKDELAIPPVWHHTADRVKAHILVCFLAYAMWKTLAQCMRGAGLGNAPRTVLEEFARVKSGDVVLATRLANGQPGGGRPKARPDHLLPRRGQRGREP